ncbi:MAG: hypothetical protein ABSB11_07880 [Sedimentisphaerales bacterium]
MSDYFFPRTSVLDCIDIDVICIPEQARVCLLGLGALGLLMRKRRA